MNKYLTYALWASTAILSSCMNSEEMKTQNVKTVTGTTLKENPPVLKMLKVTFDSKFPGIQSYSYGAKHAEVRFPLNTDYSVILNGKSYLPKIKAKINGNQTAIYSLDFPELQVSMDVNFIVKANTIQFTITNIQEKGTTWIRTIAIPGLTFLVGQKEDQVAISKFPAGYYASGKLEDMDFFGKVAEVKDGDSTTNYIFVTQGNLVSGLFNNVIDEKKRILCKKENGILKVTNGTWIWREVRSETTETPMALLIVSDDLNQDGIVTWQDGAIAYRENTPVPYGGERIKDYPLYHINMNFASQASFPFLRSLDNIKKLYLITDGLGQRVQYKGFASEGHDSAHPDYAGNVGIRQGGVDELNLVMRRGHDFNTVSGVHINATEYHREAKAFGRNANFNEDSIGWSWLDESYYTDQKKELVEGTLYNRLEAMRKDLPFLDFVYLDVYHGMSWIGWKMYRKTNALGLWQTTEFPGVMERGVIWNHIANDWSQKVWGCGDQSEIARFIHTSQKDTFNHTPLLRGANSDGFMGWHGERNFNTVVKSAFTVNLPTKYLQHFNLLKTETTQATFSDGVVTTFEDKTAKIYRNGKLINSCTYEKANTRPTNNLVFMPWSPYDESKIYHWNDKGGATSWIIPDSWKNQKTAYLYKLTDLGRIYLGEIAIEGDTVILSNIEKETPYVLYKTQAQPLPTIEWGEGSLVKDPGFDSHSFNNWNLISGNAQIKNDDMGQTYLEVSEPATLRQTIKGLIPGKIYSASIWTEIKEKRDVSLVVSTHVPTLQKPEIDKEDWKIISKSKSQGNSNAEKVFDNDQTTLWHTAYGKNQPKYPHELIVDFSKNIEFGGFIQSPRTGLHNGTIKDYEAYVSQDLKTWEKVSSGEFDYSKLPVAIKFTKPVNARYFKLVAKSERKGQDFAAIAELDFMIDSQSLKSLKKETEILATNTIQETKFKNYADTSAKFLRNWHRVKVLFTAPENGMVDFSLIAGEGTGVVGFDHARVVESNISKPQITPNAKIILFEDFENVDEGWGPFVYGFQGPTCTHLSETNLPYTDDTIRGKFSLKTRNEGTEGVVYRTIPASLKLKPNTNYIASFSYKSRDCTNLYQFIVGSDDTEAKTWQKFDLQDSGWIVKRAQFKFTTDNSGNLFIGIGKKKKSEELKGKIDNFILDDLMIIENKTK